MTEAGDYRSSGDEFARAESCLRAGEALLLVGPPGCGKATLVQELGRRLGLLQSGCLVDFGKGVAVGPEEPYSEQDMQDLVVEVRQAARRGKLFVLQGLDRLTAEEAARLLRLVRELRTGGEPGAADGASLRFVATACDIDSLASDLADVADISLRDEFTLVEVGYLPPADEAQLVRDRTSVSEDVAAAWLAIIGESRRIGFPRKTGYSTSEFLRVARRCGRGATLPTAAREVLLDPAIVGERIRDPTEWPTSWSAWAWLVSESPDRAEWGSRARPPTDERLATMGPFGLSAGEHAAALGTASWFEGLSSLSESELAALNELWGRDEEAGDDDSAPG